MDEKEVGDINGLLSLATVDDVLTPYIAYERVRTILATHFLNLPKSWLEGPSGYVVLPLRKYGDAYGMNDKGEFFQQDSSDCMYSLYFEWINDGTTDGYAIFTSLVTDKELEEILKDYHEENDTLSEDVTLNIPLLLRIMEYSKEDAKTDMDLHRVAEKMDELSKDGPLSMKDYEKLVK